MRNLALKPRDLCLETRPTIQLVTSLQFFSWGLGAPSSEKVSFFRASPSFDPHQPVPFGDYLIASLAWLCGPINNPAAFACRKEIIMSNHEQRTAKVQAALNASVMVSTRQTRRFQTSSAISPSVRTTTKTAALQKTPRRRRSSRAPI